MINGKRKWLSLHSHSPRTPPGTHPLGYHYKICAYNAWFVGFRNRGILPGGSWADIIVYNLEELGHEYNKPVIDTDFPRRRTLPGA